MPLAEKGVRGKAAGLAPPQRIETRSADSAPKQITNAPPNLGWEPAKAWMS
jgi:hypothetical protein